MINDCNIDLKDPNLLIGPALPINSTTAVSTIHRKVNSIQDFPFLPPEYQMSNKTEFIAYIFRQNTTAPQVYNFCERRELNVT